MRRFFFFIGFLYCSTVAYSQTVAGEANLKAAFIYNFTKYIDWDPADLKENFIIGVIGESPVKDPLLQIAKSNTAKNKRIVIRYYDKPDDIGDCNILFITGSTIFTLESILEHTSKGVLTISEEPGFANLGTALNFVVQKNKLKFEANLKAIYSAGLTASSQLLKLAIIIDN